MTRKTKIIIILLSILSFAGAGLSVGFGVAYGKKNTLADSTQKKINGLYEQNFYDALDNMDNVEKKLSKVSALSQVTLTQSYLYEIWRQCSVSVSILSDLATENEDMEKVMKFLNQTGDYSFYLAGKGEPLTEEERNNLSAFKSVLSAINTALFALQGQLADHVLPTSVLTDLTVLGESVKNSSTIEYPSLLYDGPFSDGLTKKKSVFLEGKETCSEETCLQKAKTLFPNGSNFQKTGENQSGTATYLFSFTEDGESCVVQITQKGGYPIEYCSYAEGSESVYTMEQCKVSGQQFLEQAGYENMECVWSYSDESTVYLNFAYDLNGVICYADLIKIKVDAKRGKVIGMEGQNYLLNHTERTLPLIKKNITLSPYLTAIGTRDCIIPTEWGTEIYCKELQGTLNGEMYYVYYDYATGEEVKAFLVVDDLPL